MTQWIFEMTKTGDLAPFEPPTKPEEKEALSQYRQRLGFRIPAEGHIGDEEQMLPYLAWYERSHGDGHQFLAEWGDMQACKLIFVPNWPTLIKLQTLAAPIIQAALFEFRLASIERMAKKAFRAWHEHDSEDVCMGCDPDEAKERDEQRAKARAARAARRAESSTDSSAT
ncbi:MAG TPA: hypothetical protein PKE31_11435 [Pseudomonadota bacterium]|nr:hypothetical protein [Pseudomonadota bacterium]